MEPRDGIPMAAGSFGGFAMSHLTELIRTLLQPEEPLDGLEALPGQNPNHNTDMAKLEMIVEATQACIAHIHQQHADIQGHSDEEGDDLQPRGSTMDLEQPIDEKSFAHLPIGERQAAIRRAKNRERTRRSRQKKLETKAQLTQDLKALHQENLLLLECIQEFAQRSMSCTAEHGQLRVQLQALIVALQKTQQGGELEEEKPPTSQDINNNNNNNNIISNTDASFLSSRPTTAAAMATTRPLAPPASSLLSSSFVHPTAVSQSLLASLALPHLEDLPRFDHALSQGQITARDTLSARAAMAEHMAILSRDNSPRDDEAGAAAGTTTAKALVDGNGLAIVGQQQQQQQQQQKQYGAMIVFPHTIDAAASMDIDINCSE